ncbi:zinc finger HIT domain-containing protein 3 [Carica papaya]|uniref:zinc finger HIT domain-containing protein 3 n=1 Tax=Carica papaya TaxID=3649 RepID=UPI000B8CB8F9|nr:zinc finger HIT domain-containing protein 3 [Carica papaya]
MSPPALRLCQICTQTASKYKCPSCLAPYCSLACFKKHKETPCAKPESTEERPTVVQELPIERELNVDDPSLVLEQKQLEAIASSCEIREALKDENLQELIYNIDCSLDALNELEKYMGVEAFCMFTDKVLSNINL